MCQLFGTWWPGIAQFKCQNHCLNFFYDFSPHWQLISPCRTFFFFGNRNSGVVQFGFVPSCSIMWACVLVKVLLLELSIFFVKSNAQLGVMNNSGMRFFNEGIGFINKVTISEVKNNIKIIAILRLQ